MARDKSKNRLSAESFETAQSPALQSEPNSFEFWSMFTSQEQEGRNYFVLHMCCIAKLSGDSLSKLAKERVASCHFNKIDPSGIWALLKYLNI